MRKSSMETKKTKFAALTAAFAITALVATACSGSSISSSPSASTNSAAPSINGAGQTLTVLIGADGKYGAQQQQWFKDVSAAFQKQTGATVNFQTFASGSEELTKIQTSVVANQGPDIYVVGTTFTPTAYSTGAFVSLTADDWNAVGGKDKFVPNDLGISGPSDSDQVGIPYNSGPFVMVYNTDLLAKAGIDKPATTWDGLVAQAKQLTGNGVYGMAIGYNDGFDPWKFIWAMSRQAGNTIISGKVARANNFSKDDRAVVNIIRGRGTNDTNPATKGHFHESSSEFWFVMEGQVRYAMETQPTFVADQGDVVYAPIRMWHLASLAGDGMSARIPFNGYVDLAHHYMAPDAAH